MARIDTMQLRLTAGLAGLAQTGSPGRRATYCLPPGETFDADLLSKNIMPISEAREAVFGTHQAILLGILAVRQAQEPQRVAPQCGKIEDAYGIYGTFLPLYSRGGIASQQRSSYGIVRLASTKGEQPVHVGAFGPTQHALADERSGLSLEVHPDADPHHVYLCNTGAMPLEIYAHGIGHPTPRAVAEAFLPDIWLPAPIAERMRAA